MAALVHDEPWVDWMQSWSPAGWLGMANRAPAASADLVRRRQRDLLEHAHARSQFYRRHHGRHPGALMPAWQDLPPLRPTLTPTAPIAPLSPASAPQPTPASSTPNPPRAPQPRRRLGVWVGAGDRKSVV